MNQSGNPGQPAVRIGAYLDAQLAAGVVVHVEHATPRDLEPGARERWYVRMHGEEKSVITVWLTCRERTLHAETYVAPAPAESIAAAYEYALRVSRRIGPLAFCIGGEDAFYLQTEVPLETVDDAVLDRILGSLYSVTEATFPTLMAIGHGSVFRRPAAPHGA